MTKELEAKIQEMREKMGNDCFDSLKESQSLDDINSRTHPHGVFLSEDLAQELLEIFGHLSTKELTEEELLTISGGVIVGWPDPPPPPPP